jgi:hypothetical protein
MTTIVKARILAVMLACGLLATPALTEDKHRDWQTGKLVSIEQGVSGSGLGVILPNTNPTFVAPTQYRIWVYTIETEARSYGFSAPGTGWHQRARPLTIGNQVKFALGAKADAFLIDESGKEFKASVVKQAAKQPAR